MIGRRIPKKARALKTSSTFKFPSSARWAENVAMPTKMGVLRKRMLTNADSRASLLSSLSSFVLNFLIEDIIQLFIKQKMLTNQLMRGINVKIRLLVK